MYDLNAWFIKFLKTCYLCNKYISFLYVFLTEKLGELPNFNKLYTLLTFVK